ncbi:MAG: hypothetical protein P4L70_03875 [Parasulfuritortus sp.]|jgi:hypothetical protein|nr:hypothetical protein [Parasulfuritortus sp.]
MKPTTRNRLLALLVLATLSACGSNPPPPDWKLNAQSALENFEKAYLTGNTALADLSFSRARAEAARTGQVESVARIELARCATRAAALEFDDCPAYAALKEGASPEEKSYAAFITGNWQSVDSTSLPGQYAPLLKSGVTADPGQIKDPLSRLIAAGVLFRQNRINPAGITTAIDTASEQGWRRPLLAWLGVELKRAEAAGDPIAIARLQQRISLVESSIGH